MDMLAFQDPQALTGLFTFVCAIAAFACYIYIGWVVPIKKMKDPNATKTQKNTYGFMLFLFGICPILYLIYLMMKGRMSKGNANSPNTGGTPPPPVNVVPNTQPSTAAGAAPSVVVENPAPGNMAIGKKN